MTNVIWETILDNKYQCEVRRIDDSTGELFIFEGEDKIFSKEVGLNYRAIFGPDVDDIALWQQIVINFIDNQERS